MKNLFLSITLSAFCLSLFAAPKGDVTKAELNKIITLDATKDDVIKTLGEPDKIMAMKGSTNWVFNKKDINIRINWDEKTSSISNLQYTSNKERAEKWVMDWQSKLEIEKSTFAQVLNDLGIPDGIIASAKEQQSIKYNYTNYKLTMLFNNGVLTHYELSKA